MDNTAVGRSAHAEKVNSDSQIIQGLAARRAALPSGSSFDQVATAVLAANSRAAGCPGSASIWDGCRVTGRYLDPFHINSKYAGGDLSDDGICALTLFGDG